MAESNPIKTRMEEIKQRAAAKQELVITQDGALVPPSSTEAKSIPEAARTVYQPTRLY